MSDSEIPEIKVGVDADGTPIMRRVMTQEMIEDRDDLNMANTASSRARRAAEARARMNGNGNGNGHKTLLPDEIVGIDRLDDLPEP